MNWIKKHPLLFGGIVFNIILLLILLIIFLNQNSKTALIDVLITPTDSEITLDGQTLENFKTQQITPGDHMVKIKKDGLKTKEFSIKTEENKTTQLHTYLISEDNNLEYYKNNFKDGELLLKVCDKNIEKFCSDLKTSSDFLKKLPIKYANFSADYKEYQEYTIRQSSDAQCSNIFCLEINDVNGTNYNNAIQIIKDNNADPDFFKILYKYKPVEKL